MHCSDRVIHGSPDSDRYPSTIVLLAQQRSRHIQPAFGAEKSFGQALRELHHQRKLAREQLGFDTGFDRTYISLLERGIQSPTIRTVVRLAAVLKVSPSEMIRRMEMFLTRGRRQVNNA